MEMYDPFKTFKKATLKNGLTIYHSQHDRPFFHAYFVVHAGSREDMKGKEGTAHFLEHLVSRNSAIYPDYIKNKRLFTDAGGWISFGSTSRIETDYSFMLPDDRALIGKAFDMLGSMLISEKITKQIKEQRKVILEEYSRIFTDDKMLYLDRLPYVLVLGADHRYAHSTNIGTKKTIAAIDYDDVQKFYDTYYVPKNIDIVTAGPLSLKDVVALVEKTALIDAKEGKRNAIPKPWTPKIPKTRKREESLSKLFSIKTPQTEYQRVWALPVVDRDTLGLLRSALNHILFEEVREKRSLAYSFDCSFYQYQSFFMLVIDGKVSSNKATEVDELVIEILKDIPRIEKAFEDAKNRRLKGLLMYDASIEKYVEDAVSDIELDHRIRTHEEVYGDCEKARWTDAHAILGLLDPKRGSLLLITP